MTDESLLFDAELSRLQKDQGKWLAAENRRGLLTLAQTLAEKCARQKPSRETNADEVQSALIGAGHTPQELGPAAGSIFRDETKWKFTGRWVQSKRVSNHSRMLRVWRLV